MSSKLLIKDFDLEDTATLIETIQKIRGLHAAYLTPAENGFLRIYVRGTSRAVERALEVIIASGLVSDDQNADHDHDACIAAAVKMGVPASWAHTPETYLSM